MQAEPPLAKRLVIRLVLASGVALVVGGVVLVHIGYLVEGILSTFIGVALANVGVNSLKDLIQDYWYAGERAILMSVATTLAGLGLIALGIYLLINGSVSAAILGLAGGLVILSLGLELILYKPEA